MIALKLLFQSLAGVGSVLVCAGGGYYVMREGNEENFYLVSATKEGSDSPSTELWTVETIKTTSGNNSASQTNTSPDTKTFKNYFCQTGEGEKTKKDESCELYSLTVDATAKTLSLDSIKKFIQDSKITTSITKTTIAELTSKKFFLLKASSSLSQEWTFEGSEKIKLFSKAEEKGSSNTKEKKSYGDLTVLSKISKDSVKGKSAFAIVKNIELTPPTLTTTAANKTYKCSFIQAAKEESKKACSVVLVGTITSGKTIKDVTFSSITIPSTQAAITFTKDSYYLVNWTTDKINFSSLKEKNLFFIEESTDTKKQAKFSIEAPVFIEPSTNGLVTEAIIIK